MADTASRLLVRHRDKFGMSQRGAAIRIGEILDGDEPPARWVQHIESGPPCPLSNYRRLWAYFEVLKLDPVEYLAARGCAIDSDIWRP